MKQDATVISIRDFRANTGNWIDRANKGESILLDHHGKDSDCYLVPIKQVKCELARTEALYEHNRHLANTNLDLSLENKSLKESRSICYWVIAIEAVLLAGLLASLLWGG